MPVLVGFGENHPKHFPNQSLVWCLPTLLPAFLSAKVLSLKAPEKALAFYLGGEGGQLRGMGSFYLAVS